MTTTTTTAPVTFPCEAGIKRSEDNTGTILWIRSPRTDKKLELFLSPFWQGMLTPRLVSRITHSCANSRATTDLTREDLISFKRAVDAVASTRSQKPSLIGPHRRRGHF